MKMPERRNDRGSVWKLRISTVAFAVSVFLGSWGNPASGATYYVAPAPAGNDSHNGLVPDAAGAGEGPWATLQKCADNMGAGDTCNVRGGVYRQHAHWLATGQAAGTTGNPITVQGYPPDVQNGNLPVFDGSVVINSGWTNNGDGTWSRTYNERHSESASHDGECEIRPGHPYLIFQNGTPLIEDNGGTLETGRWRFSNSTITVRPSGGVDPNTGIQDFEAASICNLIYVYNHPQMVFKDLLFTKGREQIVRISSADGIIERVTAQYGWKFNFKIKGARMVIRDVISEFGGRYTNQDPGGGFAIRVLAGNEMTFDGIKIRNNGVKASGIGKHGSIRIRHGQLSSLANTRGNVYQNIVGEDNAHAVMGFDGGCDHTIRDNVFRRNKNGIALVSQIAGNSSSHKCIQTGFIIERNKFENNDEYAIEIFSFIEDPNDPLRGQSPTPTLPNTGNPTIIRNNIFKNNNGGLFVRQYGLVVVNNTFVSNSSGSKPYEILFTEENSKAPNCQGSTHLLRKECTPAEFVVSNNIFYEFSGVALQANSTIANRCVARGCFIDGNLYSSSKGGSWFSWFGGHSSVQAFNSATGYEANGVQGNPLMTDPTNDDFHLQGTSPAIDAGVSGIGCPACDPTNSETIEPLGDMENSGRPSGGGWDIGAYEYGGSTALTASVTITDTVAVPMTSSNVPLLREKSWTVILRTSRDVVDIPAPFNFRDSDGNVHSILLSAQNALPLPTSAFVGTFSVDATVSDGSGTFDLALDALRDTGGNTGESITSGAQAIIDKTPPAPPNLVIVQ